MTATIPTRISPTNALANPIASRMVSAIVAIGDVIQLLVVGRVAVLLLVQAGEPGEVAEFFRATLEHDDARVTRLPPQEVEHALECLRLLVRAVRKANERDNGDPMRAARMADDVLALPGHSEVHGAADGPQEFVELLRVLPDGQRNRDRHVDLLLPALVVPRHGHHEQDGAV